MTEVAGEAADGLLVHGFTTERYLREVSLPALERGAGRAGKTLADLTVSYPGFVVTGATEEERAAASTAVRQQIAFYGSTPAYRGVLELHGWDDLHPELNTLSKRGEWVKMGELIDDEVLNAFAVVAPLDEVPARVLERFGDVVDRFSFYAPYRLEPEQWRALVAGFHGAWRGPVGRRAGRRRRRGGHVDDAVRIRLLEASEGAVLTAAVRAAYGDTYDAHWVYDPEEIARRIAQGHLVSCVAVDRDGSLLSHIGLNRHSPHDEVGHAGQAVTMPAARGRHLFTAVKRHLAGWAESHGMVGIYSEATAAHPYSQAANVALGAHETGFLLGWIPGTVRNDAALAAAPRRQSAALFYLRMRPGHTRPVYAPAPHREMVHQIITTCALRGRLADPPREVRLPAHTRLHTVVDRPHNTARLTVRVLGADLTGVVERARTRLFGDGVDALYLDLPLEVPATALVAGHLSDLGVSFSGIFPNAHADGDVLRMQSLHNLNVTADDVAVASEHGRQLLRYVLDDLGPGATAAPAGVTPPR